MTASRPVAWRQVQLVATREVRERTRASGFRIGTAVVSVLAVALVLVPQLVGEDEAAGWTVVVSGTPPPGLEEALAGAPATPGGAVTLRVDDAGAGPEALLDGGDVDAVLVDGAQLVVEERDDELAAVLTGAVAQAQLADRLAERGVDAEEVRSFLTAAPLEVRSLDPDDADDDDTREQMAFFGVVGLFIAIATYGSWVLTSVLEEKANRIVEVLLSAVTPRQLLAGKVLGAGAVGLAQLAIVVLAALAAAAASDALPDVELGATAAALLLWFLLGFAFYAVGYAAAGSLVSRQEDAQSAVTPMVAIVMVAYFASLAVVVPDPDGALARVVSLLPPVAPLAMPARTAAGAVAPWEVALAVALMVAATWLMITLAARVYENAILRSGARVPLREALLGRASSGSSPPDDGG